MSEVLDALNEALGPHIFPDKGDGADPRACPTCGAGRLSLKTGRYGAFIGCSNYPECRFTRPIAAANGEDEGKTGDRELGVDPATGLKVWLKAGRFGPYVEEARRAAAARQPAQGLAAGQRRPGKGPALAAPARARSGRTRRTAR